MSADDHKVKTVFGCIAGDNFSGIASSDACLVDPHSAAFGPLFNSLEVGVEEFAGDALFSLFGVGGLEVREVHENAEDREFGVERLAEVECKLDRLFGLR